MATPLPLLPHAILPITASTFCFTAASHQAATSSRLLEPPPLIAQPPLVAPPPPSAFPLASHRPALVPLHPASCCVASRYTDASHPPAPPTLVTGDAPGVFRLVHASLTAAAATVTDRLQLCVDRHLHQHIEPSSKSSSLTGGFTKELKSYHVSCLRIEPQIMQKPLQIEVRYHTTISEVFAQFVVRFEVVNH